MDEDAWMTGVDALAMLEYLRDNADKASDRKLRLFAVACCRRVWRRLIDPRSQLAVEEAERYADGASDLARLREVRRGAELVAQDARQGIREDGTNLAARAAEASAVEDIANVPGPASSLANLAAGAYTRMEGIQREPALFAEIKAHCDLLRCIVGNPFRPLPAINTAWLAWNGGTVPKLARAIYDARDFDRLPILADALQEAGCDDTAILNHCRGPDSHTRGCWVVDLVLGRK